MGKLNRGNLLATLKKLKKTPRPKVVIANPAVQAICGGSSPKPNKVIDLKVTVERRRTLLGSTSNKTENLDLFTKSMEEYERFMQDYRNTKVSAAYIIQK